MNSRWATQTADRCDDGMADQFAQVLAQQGQTVTRRRPGRSDGSLSDATITVRVVLDILQPRPFYPQGVESSGLDNLSNVDRHYLFFAPAVDIDELDEITFVAYPEHLWIVDKGGLPFAPGDVTIYNQVEIRRERRQNSDG